MTQVGRDDIVNSPTRLSDDQAAAVISPSKYIKVVAGAGTGKTEILTRRIAYLLLNRLVDPGSVVAFTFTDKAAEEIKSRVYDQILRLGGKDACMRLGEMFIGTMHSFCYMLLQKTKEHGDFDLLDENQEMAFLVRYAREIGLGEVSFYKECDIFLKSAGAVYNERIDRRSLENEAPLFANRLKLYEGLLRKHRQLTFGQLINRAIDSILGGDVDLSSVKYLLVDEYQDINHAQEELINLLGKSAEVFVVGDPRQTIYEWRGSDERCFNVFSDVFPGAAEFTIVENRRSAKAIINTANAFASASSFGYAALSPVREEEGHVIDSGFYSPEAEAKWVAEKVKDLVSAKKQCNYSDVAVLLRSVKISAQNFIDAFKDLDIPVIVGGKIGLFKQEEVKAIAKLFSWLPPKGFWRGDFSTDGAQLTGDSLLSSAISDWNSALSHKKIDLSGVKKPLEDWKRSVLSGRFKSLVGMFDDLLARIRYLEFDQKNKVDSAIMANLGRFSSLLEDYEASTRFGGAERGLISQLYGLCNFINYYAFSSYDSQESDNTKNADAVHIMTVHQAKGLEWRVVFLSGISSGMFPIKLAGRGREWYVPSDLFDSERYEGGEASERRLFYVAMTRAKDVLCFTYSLRENEDAPSEFLVDIKRTVSPSGGDFPDIATRYSESSDMLHTFTTGEITSYLRCPYFYRFRTVWGYKPELVEALGYGKSLHYCLKEISEAMANTSDLSGLTEETINRVFHLPFANPRLNQIMKGNAIKILSDFVVQNKSDMSRIESVEVRLEFPVEKATISGRVDVIIKNESENSVEVRDYKTSDEVTTPEESDLQVKLYSLGLSLLGKKVTDGSVANLEKNEIRRFSITNKDLAAAKSKAEAAINGVASQNFEPKVGEHCSKCDFLSICSQGRNYLKVY